MELYFDENNYLVFSGVTTDYVLCVTDINANGNTNINGIYNQNAKCNADINCI